MEVAQAKPVISTEATLSRRLIPLEGEGCCCSFHFITGFRVCTLLKHHRTAASPGKLPGR